jgi:MarR family transcriptional regulator, lower aerobic nicotinate degradation pathway regulator
MQHTLGSEASPPQATLQQFERLFSHLQQSTFRIAALVTRGSELTFQQYLVLAHLGEHGHCSVNELREALGSAQSSTSELTSRLERISLITKERDPRDGRSIRLSLTPKGREALKRRRHAAARLYQEILAPKSAGERQALIIALEVVLQGLGGKLPQQG